MKKFWFKRKRYGFGWVPSSWEGWLVTVFFVVIVIFIGISFNSETTIVEVVGSLAVPMLLLTAVCYMTGESPKWQWDEKRKHEKEDGTFE